MAMHLIKDKLVKENTRKIKSNNSAIHHHTRLDWSYSILVDHIRFSTLIFRVVEHSAESHSSRESRDIRRLLTYQYASHLPILRLSLQGIIQQQK